MANPSFTAQAIFKVSDPEAFHIVRELGYWNFIIGSLGLCSLFNSSWVLPVGIAGCLFYGLAGGGHLAKEGRNAHEIAAMISDLFVFAVLAFYCVAIAVRTFNAPGN